MKPGFTVMILASILSTHLAISNASTLNCRQLASVAAGIQHIRDKYPNMDTYNSYMKNYTHIWNTEPLNIQTKMAPPSIMSMFVQDEFLHFNSLQSPTTVYWGVFNTCEQQEDQ
jgi:hypothetical protein